MTDDKMVWIDIETTGLDPKKDKILEIGIVITDPFAVIQFEKSWLVDSREPIGFLRDSSDEFVRDMHDKSGLWSELDAYEVEPVSGEPAYGPVKFTTERLNKEVTNWIDDCFGHADDNMEARRFGPMCGSSVHFDRSFTELHLPTLDIAFHYRNIDISTIGEVCRRVNPLVYAGRDEMLSPEKAHRVIPDIYDTLEEYAFYLDNFLFVPGNEE